MKLGVQRKAKPPRGKMSRDLVEKAAETKKTPTSLLPRPGDERKSAPGCSPLRQSGNNAAQIGAGITVRPRPARARKNSPLTPELKKFIDRAIVPYLVKEYLAEIDAEHRRKHGRSGQRNPGGSARV
jgi:hypothetical protein